jgi:hypothetical protein
VVLGVVLGLQGLAEVLKVIGQRPTLVFGVGVGEPVFGQGRLALLLGQELPRDRLVRGQGDRVAVHGAVPLARLDGVLGRPRGAGGNLLAVQPPDGRLLLEELAHRHLPSLVGRPRPKKEPRTTHRL